MHLSNALGSLGHVGTVLGPCGVTRWERCDVMGQEGWQRGYSEQQGQWKGASGGVLLWLLLQHHVT